LDGFPVSFLETTSLVIATMDCKTNKSIHQANVQTMDASFVDVMPLFPLSSLRCDAADAINEKLTAFGFAFSGMLTDNRSCGDLTEEFQPIT
jgi:hypothetical protein